VNADGLGPEAALRIELLDQYERPLPDYSGTNAAIVRHSGFQTPVLWHGEHALQGLPDQVRLRVTFDGPRNTEIRFSALYLQSQSD